jgi:hypothetical protein
MLPLAMVPKALAWGNEGRMTGALIGEQLLAPAQEKFDALLQADNDPLTDSDIASNDSTINEKNVSRVMPFAKRIENKREPPDFHRLSLADSSHKVSLRMEVVLTRPIDHTV